MLAIIRITFCILEYDIGRSFLIKNTFVFNNGEKLKVPIRKIVV